MNEIPEKMIVVKEIYIEELGIKVKVGSILDVRTDRLGTIYELVDNKKVINGRYICDYGSSLADECCKPYNPYVASKEDDLTQDFKKRIDKLIKDMKQLYEDVNIMDEKYVDLNKLKELGTFSKDYSCDIQDLVYGFKEARERK